MGNTGSGRPGTSRVALAGSTALVTGATGGIGQAIARALADRGTRVILTGRRAELLESLAEELGAQAIACDLGSREDVARLAETARRERTGILIANAAVPASGLLPDLGQAELDAMLEVNLRAPIALARALAPDMISRGEGQLVFVSSLQGKAAVPASALYSASKFGLRGFALALREDLRTAGVGVSTIFPGFIRDAGMFAETGVKLPWHVGTRSPEDVAAAVVRAIEEDRAEIDVAPITLRLGAAFAGLAPSVAAAVSRRLGAHEISGEIVARQRARD